MDLQKLELLLDKFEAESVLALTKHEYACIHLRIPETGNVDLDAWIAKAQRRDVAVLAMKGMLSCQDFMNDALKVCRSKEEAREEVARHSMLQADVLLAELAETEQADA